MTHDELAFFLSFFDAATTTAALAVFLYLFITGRVLSAAASRNLCQGTTTEILAEIEERFGPANKEAERVLSVRDRREAQADP